jgi:hypothetical protein
MRQAERGQNCLHCGDDRLDRVSQSAATSQSSADGDAQALAEFLQLSFRRLAVSRLIGHPPGHGDAERGQQTP